jgi:predicted Fe-S protein YdhL (DUF1289 family)
MSLRPSFTTHKRQEILMSNTPESPCISICSLDQNDVCEGCFRAGNEIVDWFTADDDRKREILEASTQRRKDAGFSIF